MSKLKRYFRLIVEFFRGVLRVKTISDFDVYIRNPPPYDKEFRY